MSTRLLQEFVCDKCAAVVVVQASVGAPLLTVPNGTWSYVNGKHICDKHEVVIQDKEDA